MPGKDRARHGTARKGAVFAIMIWGWLLAAGTAGTAERAVKGGIMPCRMPYKELFFSPSTLPTSPTPATFSIVLTLFSPPPVCVLLLYFLFAARAEVEVDVDEEVGLWPLPRASI